MGVFHVTLHISSLFLFHFTVLLLIMQSQPVYFLNRTKHHMLDNLSKKYTLEVSVMATELVSSTILFPTKKLCSWIKNVNTLHRYLFKALLCILFKFDQVSFYVVVWPVWLMLHSFVPALACYIIFMYLPFDHRR